MRIATLALCLAGASAFVGPAAPRRLPLRRRAVAELVATGEALVRSQALAGELGAPGAVLEALPSSDVLVAFADQGGNLAGKFFMGSLPPYALFLYFLNYEGNNAPPLVRFGFAYLLLFVAATIPTGIIAKATWGVSLADADWLHGGAESLLTVTNVLLLLGFRGALGRDGAAADAGWARLGAGVAAAAAVALIATGVPTFHFEAHDAFLGGVGALPPGAFPAEPVNALSVPTWAVHFSSVCEFVLAMRLAVKYAAWTGDEKWNGVAWGMLPSHASGVCACTYHLFYNQAALAWLVTAQAGLTFLGNCTLCVAAFRLAVANGWTLAGAAPAFAGGPERPREPYALDAARVSAADPGLAPGPELVAEIAAFTLVAAYATKYGSLYAVDFLAAPNAAAAAACVALPPLAVALTVLPAPEAPDVSYDDVKKYGVAGTLAYVLTELAFWAVAFPVAAAVFAQTNGHAPDLLHSNGDRAAVAAFVFAGANVARLAVPLRFGVALAAAPWVDANVVKRFARE